MDTYEKKYKNALTIAQSRFKIEKDESVLTCLGMMFPELRESEDEAIRKSIVATIEQCPDDFLNPKNRDRMLDWLEKQKESNIPWYDYQKSKEAGYTIVPNEEYERLIKQKEPKPAWSEEDERIVGRIQMILEFFDRNYPADMNIGSEVPKYITWLKSLRPQTKQEWSEEDEKHINLILRVLDIQQCWDGATGKRFNPYQDEINWLKSIHPFWKPSEELLDALKELIDDANRAGWVTPGATELYEQLKKL